MKTKQDVLWLVLISLITLYVGVYAYSTKSPAIFAIVIAAVIVLISIWIDTVTKIKKNKISMSSYRVVNHYQFGEVEIVEYFNNDTASIRTAKGNRFTIRLADTDH